MNDMYPPFVLKSQKIEKLEDFYSYQILFLFVPDPNLFVAIDCLKDLSVPEPVLFVPEPVLFVLGPILFIPDPILVLTGSEFIKLLLTIPEISNFIVSQPFI